MQKDEIKEILEYLKDDKKISFGSFGTEYKRIELNDIKLLLNYIINLQQKIEKLENDKRGMLVQLYKANDEKDNYKSKCEKAIEYIKTKEVDFVDVHYQQQDDYFNGLLNILQGSDK